MVQGGAPDLSQYSDDELEAIARKNSGSSASPKPANLRDLARQIAIKHGLDPDIFERQIQQESSFNPKSYTKNSIGGAYGLGQLTNSELKRFGEKARYDPVANLEATATLMREHLDKAGSYQGALLLHHSGKTQIGPGEPMGHLYVRKILGHEYNDPDLSKYSDAELQMIAGEGSQKPALPEQAGVYYGTQDYGRKPQQTYYGQQDTAKPAESPPVKSAQTKQQWVVKDAKGKIVSSFDSEQAAKKFIDDQVLKAKVKAAVEYKTPRQQAQDRVTELAGFVAKAEANLKSEQDKYNMAIATLRAKDNPYTPPKPASLVAAEKSVASLNRLLEQARRAPGKKPAKPGAPRVPGETLSVADLVKAGPNALVQAGYPPDTPRDAVEVFFPQDESERIRFIGSKLRPVSRYRASDIPALSAQSKGVPELNAAINAQHPTLGLTIGGPGWVGVKQGGLDVYETAVANLAAVPNAVHNVLRADALDNPSRFAEAAMILSMTFPKGLKGIASTASGAPIYKAIEAGARRAGIRNTAEAISKVEQFLFEQKPKVGDFGEPVAGTGVDARFSIQPDTPVSLARREPTAKTSLSVSEPSVPTRKQYVLQQWFYDRAQAHVEEVKAKTELEARANKPNPFRTGTNAWKRWEARNRKVVEAYQQSQARSQSLQTLTDEYAKTKSAEWRAKYGPAEGKQNAISQQEAEPVHENVRQQPVEGQEPLPQQEGGPGVRPSGQGPETERPAGKSAQPKTEVEQEPAATPKLKLGPKHERFYTDTPAGRIWHRNYEEALKYSAANPKTKIGDVVADWEARTGQKWNPRGTASPMGYKVGDRVQLGKKIGTLELQRRDAPDGQEQWRVRLDEGGVKDVRGESLAPYKPAMSGKAAYRVPEVVSEEPSPTPEATTSPPPAVKSVGATGTAEAASPTSSAATSEVGSTPAASTTKPIPQGKPLIGLTGNDTVGRGVFDRRHRYALRNRIVSLDDVLNSHTYEGEANKSYWQELQDRSRDQESTRLQVREMIAKFDPSRMIDDFEDLRNGSPVVGPDSMVEGGNGRITALRRIREQHPDLWEAYQQHLREKARELGFDPADIDKIKDPILVRERLDAMEPDRRVEFAAETNAPDTAEMTATERALRDSRRIPEAALSEMYVPEDATGEQIVLHQANAMKIVQPFVQSMSATEKAGIMVGRELSQAGLERIVNALFIKAYGPEGIGLLRNLRESVKLEDAKRLQNALFATLGDVAKFNGEVSQKLLPADYAISDDILAAAKRYIGLKAAGDDPVVWASHPELFDPVPQAQKDLVAGFEHNSASEKRLSAFIREYLDMAREYGHGSIKGEMEGYPSKSDLVRQADAEIVAKAKNKDKNVSPSQAALLEVIANEAPPETGGMGGDKQAGAVSLAPAKAAAERILQRAKEVWKGIFHRPDATVSSAFVETLGKSTDILKRLGGTGKELSQNVSQMTSVAHYYESSANLKMQHAFNKAKDLAAAAGKTNELYRLIGHLDGGAKLTDLIAAGKPIPSYAKPLAKAWESIVKERRKLQEQFGAVIVQRVGEDLPGEKLVGQNVQYVKDGRLVKSKVVAVNVDDGITHDVMLANGDTLTKGEGLFRYSVVDPSKYVPLVLKPGVINQLRKELRAGGGPLLERLRGFYEHQMNLKGDAVDRAVANLMEGENESVFGTPAYSALRRVRGLKTAPREFYDDDFLRITQRHIRSTAQDIAWARQFGPFDMGPVGPGGTNIIMPSKLRALLKGLPDAKAVSQAEAVMNNLRGEAGYLFPATGNVARYLMNWTAASKISGVFTVFRQPSTIVNDIAMSGLGNTLKAHLENIKGALNGSNHIQKAVRIAGAVGEDYSDLMSISDLGSTSKSLVRTVTWPMRKADEAFRVPGSYAGYLAARDLVGYLKTRPIAKGEVIPHGWVKVGNTLVKQDRNYRLLSDWFEFTDKDIVRLKNEGFTKGDAIHAINKGSENSIRAHPKDLPYMNLTHPGTRVLFQLSQFPIGQARLFGHLLHEAVVHGNAAPLIKFTVGSVIAGEVIGGTVSGISGMIKTHSFGGFITENEKLKDAKQIYEDISKMVQTGNVEWKSVGGMLLKRMGQDFLDAGTTGIYGNIIASAARGDVPLPPIAEDVRSVIRAILYANSPALKQKQPEPVQRFWTAMKDLVTRTVVPAGQAYKFTHGGRSVRQEMQKRYGGGGGSLTAVPRTSGVIPGVIK